jgi:hypothetical protein
MPEQEDTSMKWFALSVVAAALAAPVCARAQEVVEIGKITQISDRNPTTWGMSGMEMIHLTRTVGDWTPIMRSLKLDARTVEILSRTQAPPLRSSDIQHVSKNGHDYVLVRKFLLTEVMPEDARAENMSKTALAAKWTQAVRRVFPQVAPAPSRFGI